MGRAGGHQPCDQRLQPEEVQRAGVDHGSDRLESTDGSRNAMAMSAPRGEKPDRQQLVDAVLTAPHPEGVHSGHHRRATRG